MTTSGPDVERIRGFLLAQGEKLTFVEMWPRLMKARLDLVDAIDDLNAEQAAFKPAPSEWAIRDVALHVLDSSTSTRRVVERLATGASADATGAEAPMVEAQEAIESIRARLLADSIAWSAMTERLPSQPPLEPTARHPFFGALHSRAWFLFQRVHDVDHFNQIEAVKTAAGYPA